MNIAKHGHVYTFFSAKGGTGQTLISSNLAYLASKSSRTLFLQLTHYPDIHSLLNLTTEKNLVHVLEFLENGEDPLHTLENLTYRKDSLHILTSPLEVKLNKHLQKEHIQTLLTTISGCFDHIFIDLGKEFAHADTVLEMSDQILTLSHIDPQSLSQTQILSTTHKDTKLIINQTPPHLGTKKVKAYAGELAENIIGTLPTDFESTWDNVAHGVPYASQKSKLTKETEKLLKAIT